MAYGETLTEVLDYMREQCGKELSWYDVSFVPRLSGWSVDIFQLIEGRRYYGRHETAVGALKEALKALVASKD